MGTGEGQGIIQSAFLWGYMATPILGGTLADQYGGELPPCMPLHVHRAPTHLFERRAPFIVRVATASTPCS